MSQKLDHHSACVVTYNALRDALVRPDEHSDDTIHLLIKRVRKAAEKYPDDCGPAQAAENAVLEAYAKYLEAVHDERHT